MNAQIDQKEANAKTTMPEPKHDSLKPKRDLPVRSLPSVQQILVPLDFSEESVAALEYAVPFAAQFRAKLTLLHIVDAAPLPMVEGFYDYPPERVVESSEKLITDLAEKYATRDGQPALATYVGTGIPEIEICRQAREREVDLIVLNTHGYTGLRLALLGGITQSILQHAPCPVLVVRRDRTTSPKAARPLRKLLVPVDFSPRAEKAIHCAATLAAGCGATVSLVHVVEPGKLDEEMGTIGADFASYSADANCRLRALLERTVPESARGETYVRRGTAFAQVVAQAAGRDTDLIVLTTHGRSGLAHLFLGSTAERVIHHTPCPVLVVRESGLRPIPARSVASAD